MFSSQRRAFRWFLFFAVLLPPAGAFAQQGGIELFSGNTIFESGTRVSLSHIYFSRGSLFSGSEEVVLTIRCGVTPTLRNKNQKSENKTEHNFKKNLKFLILN